MSLVLRRVAGGMILVLVVGLTTCSGLWSAASAATPPRPALTRA
ncbi:MAG: hypothetical protein AAFX85_08565 [Pseudomonadota bacterium]